MVFGRIYRYYAAKLNHKNGIISQNDYVDRINEVLIDYFSSPVHNAPNDTIVKDFWTDPTIEQLPYVRGFTLAFYLDTKIQSESEGHSLDNFMHDLLELINRTGKPFSFDDFSNLITSYISQEELLVVKNFISGGKSIPVFHKALGSDYSLKWEDYIGFNLQKSLAKGTIEGIKRGSIPFQAGVSNGSKILDYNRKGTVITLSVKDEKESKDISYDLLELKQVPQFISEKQESSQVP